MVPESKKIHIKNILPNYKELEKYYIVDVRSPGEYAEDHIPGAVNYPVLNNEERKEVGTIYKQISAKKAKVKGAVYICANIANFLETLLADNVQKKAILVYCWRGGMRSGSLSTILEQAGVYFFHLHGGYKSYRKWIHDFLEESRPYNFLVIQGPSGCGKTELLHDLENKYEILDLEGLSNHKGSVLGAPYTSMQPSQKLFDSIIAKKLISSNSPFFLVEGESRKIGKIQLPNVVYENMLTASRIRIELPLELRAKRLADEYAQEEYFPKIKERLLSIKAFISSKILEKIFQALDNKNTKQASSLLLENYYDPHYFKHYKNSTENVVTNINEDTYENLLSTLSKFLENYKPDSSLNCNEVQEKIS